MEYQDFEITIEQKLDGAYPIVVHSPAGDKRTTFCLPFAVAELQAKLADLEAILFATRQTHRNVYPIATEEKTTSASPMERYQRVRTLGHALFTALFTDEVRMLYYASQLQAESKGQGLRLKLNCQTTDVASIPWELLYDPHERDFICLSRTTPIVRYLEVTQPLHDLLTTFPVQVLGVAVSPHNLGVLDIEREKQRLAKALEPLQDQIEVTWLQGQSWQHLQQAMRQKAWHILHFIGHGAFDVSQNEGLIMLADEEDAAQPLTATQLARLLADHSSLRLVLLNACEGARSSEVDMFTSTAATLIQRGIPAVLAMQYAISDRAAIEFSQAFYSAIVDRMPVDAAVTEARKALSMADAHSLEWVTPMLFMRADDGQILETLPSPPTVAQRQPTRPTFSANQLFTMGTIAGVIVLLVLVLFAVQKDRKLANETVMAPITLPDDNLKATVIATAVPTTSIMPPATVLVDPLALPEDTFKIAIAQFGEVKDDGTITATARTQRFATILSHYLDTEVKKNRFDLKVYVAHKDMPLITDEAEAEQLAHRLRAELIVYGSVTMMGSHGTFLPSFYVSDEINDTEVSGYNQLAHPIPFNSEESDENLNQILQIRAAILVNYVKGLVYLNIRERNASNIEAAEYSFQQAVLEAERLDAPFEGQEVLYLMLSYAQKLRGEYDPALANLEAALALNPDYARAFIGLGNIYYARYLNGAHDSALLDQAWDSYQWALETPRRPPSAYIEAKAMLGFGNIQIHRAGGNLALLDEAAARYQWIVDRHVQMPKDPGLARLAAYAYRGLGWIYDVQGKTTEAKAAYQQCLGLPTDFAMHEKCEKEIAAIDSAVAPPIPFN